jgi:CheY-like chemotaxis protein
MGNIDSYMKTILVVEDEPAVSAFCGRVLTGEGYKVETASNSKIAQDMVKKTQYDLLLLDIRMPVMSGIELYQWLEKEYSQMSQKVVFTTGSILSGDTNSFIAQTGRPVLAKPFTPGELATIIKETFMEIAE